MWRHPPLSQHPFYKSRYTNAMTHFFRLSTLLFCLVLFAACAPRTAPAGEGGTEVSVVETPAPESPAAREVQQTAQVAYHRMQIGFLQTGEYTTNALLDLSLPQGVRWTVETFEATTYQLRFVSAEVPDQAWIVTPEGVQVTENN